LGFALFCPLPLFSLIPQIPPRTDRCAPDDFAHQLYYQDSDFQVVGRVIDLAQQHGFAPAPIALAWLLQQPGVTAPIIGASKMKHLEDALPALKIELSEEECKQLEEPYQPHSVLGHSS
jgi:aryl-alcohol dehydrogenase (NADP+)